MKNFKQLGLVLLVLLLTTVSTSAQSQAYWVHEDVVKPAMVAEYESICKELVANMKKHDIQEVNMISANIVGGRYLFVGAIENMAQLDNSIFSTLAKKMGSKELGALLDRMNKCYDTEHDYVLHLDKELSYMPDGMAQTMEGQDYRKYHYFNYTPASETRVTEKIKTIQKLFTSKGSKLHYRVYKSGFGLRGANYMVAISAKDAVDYATMIAENNALMGEEWQNAYGDLLSSLLSYDVEEGWMRPELGYAPSK